MTYGSDERYPISNLNYKVTLIFAGAGFFLGTFISWAILIGDDLGRVNILYLLVIYLILPVASILISTISLIFGGGINLARCLKYLPLWSVEKQQLWRQLRHQGFDRLWFYQCSQIVAMCFSLSGLMVFFMLLLATDVNFVWRSTLLTAQDLIRLLSWLSTPWSFWEGAQPTIELLVQTQDSRIAPQSVALSTYAQWWQFVLAIQIFYSFLPRGLLLIGTRLIILRRLSLHKQNRLSGDSKRHEGKKELLATVVTSIEKHCTLINWGGIPDVIVSDVERHFPRQIIDRLYAGPTAEDSQQSVAQQSEVPQLVLVKSWEPPLAELADYLQTGAGYIMPLDWEQSEKVPIDSFHLEEWRRFSAAQKDWALLVWSEPSADP